VAELTEGVILENIAKASGKTSSQLIMAYLHAQALKTTCIRSPKGDVAVLPWSELAAYRTAFADLAELERTPLNAFSKPAKDLRSLRKASRRLVELALVREHVGVEHGVWVEAIQDLMRTLGTKPRCRVCGCTDDKACPGGCRWMDAALCSRCCGV